MGGGERPIEVFSDKAKFDGWLKQHHGSSKGLWLRFAKKASSWKTLSHAEALDSALCYGWIDGQTDVFDEESWVQKFTPRGKRSIWSKINCQRAEALIRAGQMQAAGQAEIDRAKEDGRWAAAYDSVRKSAVPSDLQAALDTSPKANAFFETLSSKNRYAILFRLQTAKKPETRAKRLAQYVVGPAKPRRIA